VKKRKQDEEEQDVDIMDTSDDAHLIEQNNDGHQAQYGFDADGDDVKDYFPPILVEPEEIDGDM